MMKTKTTKPAWSLIATSRMKALGVTQEDLIEAFGVKTRGAIGHYFTGRREPTIHQLNRLASKLDMSIAELTGSQTQHNVAETQAKYNLNNRKTIPVISWVAAGAWSEAIDNFSPGDAEEWITIDGDISDSAFALKVIGDSMTSPTPPSVPAGSTIIVDPNTHADHGSLVVAKLTDTNEVTFKRLVIDGARRYLEPLNPRYNPIAINGNCVICGVVKRAVMNF